MQQMLYLFKWKIKQLQFADIRDYKFTEYTEW